MAPPNEQWQQNTLIFTAYSITRLLCRSKEKQRVVWVGCQSSQGMWTCWLSVISPGICWQQRNHELRNLTVLQILKAVVGLSHSLGSTGCTSACFCPALSLPPPRPGPLRPPQASSAGCGSKSLEEHQHGSQPSLHWRLNPPYLHLVPVMALPTSPTSYLVFVLLGHLVAPAFPVPSFTGGGSMCGWLCAAMPEDFLKRKDKKHKDTHFHWSYELCRDHVSLLLWQPWDYIYQVLLFQLVSIYFSFIHLENAIMLLAT